MYKQIKIEKKGYLTDAPFVYKTKKGNLLLLWSSYSIKGYREEKVGGYTVAVASSESVRVE